MKVPKKATSRSRARPKRFLPRRELISLIVAIVFAAHWVIQHFEPSKRIIPSYSLAPPSIESLGPSVKVGFSPEGTAQSLVIEAIRAAQKTIYMSAYALTAIDISHELLEAQRRGVTVFITVDGNLAHSQLLQYRVRGGHSAIALLTAAPISVRLNYRYSAHHDKYIIIDQQHVQTGSFNYSIAAKKRNSENVILLYNVPDLAAAYFSHWSARWEEGEDYKPNDGKMKKK